MEKFKKALKFLWFLPVTVYYNFHYLPFKQAIKLPIYLYKPSLIKSNGKIIIESDNVYRGMIRLGFFNVSIYPNNGITLENHGGTIIFKGSCAIGGNSFISLGQKSTVIFGDDFVSTSSLKLVSYKKVEFGVKARIGWDTLIMDTNFHPLYDLTTKNFKKAYGEIRIGDFNWLGNGCKVMHSVSTPQRCVFGLGSVLTRGARFKSYCIHGGSPLRIISENVMRDYDNDRIIFE